MPFPAWDFIVGHEVVGFVHEVGPDVKKFKVGDRVVSAFVSSCRECFFCVRGLTCRCENSLTFGTPGLDGTQAEYARIPLADGTLFPAPADLKDQHLVLLGDIFPTGYSTVWHAWKFLPEEVKQFPTSAVVLGCGPVGLCGVLSAKQKFTKVFAVDSVQARLDQAARYGAIPILLNANTAAAIRAQTDGRGPDAVMEIVGAPDAFDLALDIVRVGGVIASCGLHTSTLHMPGLKLYQKNVALKFGRTSVIDLYDECVELLRKLVKEGKMDGFVEASVRLSNAPEYYDLFDKREIGKTLFQAVSSLN
ncbi:GroES-like protein [Calocera viscosa TUFC12733]|uniref:GroES-like protein n=1 Tax=Calocera viscosa (strain TUFC12733) TaxID=1330018 RepID=A0A167HAV1_CALVF|nr:GroES-like protein [Calocera viscosa TUFC12733]